MLRILFTSTQGAVPWAGSEVLWYQTASLLKRQGHEVAAMLPLPMRVPATRQRLAEEGIQAEVVDLRTLVPLDKDTILESVKKTGRLVIAHEAPRTSGFGAEVAALVADEGFALLKAPIKRVAAPDVPPPCSPALLRHFVPDAGKIRQAVAEVL